MKLKQLTIESAQQLILVWQYLAISSNVESVTVIKYRISGTLKKYPIPDIRYPIYIKIVQYEPDTDTNTNIITALDLTNTALYRDIV